MSSSWRTEFPKAEALKLAEEYGKDRLQADLKTSIAEIRRAAEMGMRQCWTVARSNECAQALAEQGYMVFTFPPHTGSDVERWKIVWGDVT